ncbi:CSTF2-like protein [Mya arenaria]|uniref:CSTF2-like protein n=1 Tax=Mya arenaria TaxID=6604 RepID=A0ABY7EGU5_MYAAR|nr:CSTF2-like protein [Mya arenaria]
MELEPISAHERARRSVFVGNIPYEATEEALKEIFVQAGPVVSFRLVYDRETGKPKGYGFCEYQDIETAQSALRNLNNTDFNGRPLRVGVAAGETNKDEIAGMQQALGGPVLEAPEAISKAVASLPPEQMFELMKQMKAMLHRDTSQVPPPGSTAPTIPASVAPISVDPGIRGHNPMTNPMMASPGPQPVQPVGPPLMGAPARGPGLMGPSNSMGGPIGNFGPGPQDMGGPGPRGMPPRGMMWGPGSQGMGPAPGIGPGPDFNRDPRDTRDPRDPRLLGQGDRGMGPRPGAPMINAPNTSMGGMPLAGMGQMMAGGGGGGPQDQEKAALIMQVLQLTDQQIAMLPPDQRQSILILKDQLTKNAA